MDLIPSPCQNLAAVTLPRGEVWNAIYAVLPELIFLGLISIGLSFGVTWLVRRIPAIQRGQWLCQQPSGGYEAMGWIAALALLIWIVDGACFQVGFFRQDDFSFLAVAQNGYSLSEQMVMYHNDHLYLLFRLQIVGLLTLAGPGATEVELVFWFNLVNFLVHVGVMGAAVWLLAEAGARRGTMIIFALFAWAWPGWGEYTTGYYTIGVYVQVLALGLAGVAALLRYFRTHNRKWQIIALLLPLLACGLNISGIWTVVAQGITVICLRWPVFRDPQARRHLVFSTGSFIAATLLLTVALRHERSPREYVQNPEGITVSHQVTTLQNQSIASVFLTVLSTPGGILLSQVTPTIFQYGANKIQAKPMVQLVIRLLQTIPLLVFTMWWWRRGRLHNPNGTRLLVAILLIVTSLAAMTILGRPHYAISHPALLWNPKYQIFPWLWVALGAALILETLVISRKSPPRAMIAGIGTTVTLCAFLLISHAILERNLFSKPIPYWAKGRVGNTIAAEGRRDEYHKVISALDSQRIPHDPSTVLLPAWPGWYREFSSAYPLLEWSGDSSPKGVTYLFEDLPAARPVLSMAIKMTPGPAGTYPGDKETLLWFQH